MTPSPTDHAKPLTPAFARRLRCTVLFLVACSAAGFAVASDYRVRATKRSFLKDEARLCAAALAPGTGGDLSESVEDLRDRFDGLMAVATLDTVGNLYTVHPERPANRRAALAALSDGTEPVWMISPRSGEPIRVVGVVVPLNGSQSPAARKVLVLLHYDVGDSGWMRSTALFAVLIGTIGLLAVELLTGWFDRQVARPLRGMAFTATIPADRDAGVPQLRPGLWRETVDIAERFRGLLRNVASNDVRVRRIQQEAADRLHQCEVGFSRQLRRERDRATLDPLTGLRNRTFLEEELGSLFNRCRARGRGLAAVMIDVDNFKQYNDVCGHQLGDALLQFVGALLFGVIRRTDYAIRYGGDEFLLLMPEVSAEQVSAVAQRLVKLFGQYAKRLGGERRLSISVGFATLDGDTPESGPALVARADAALYSAKRSGKGIVVGPDAVSLMSGGAHPVM